MKNTEAKGVRVTLPAGAVEWLRSGERGVSMDVEAPKLYGELLYGERNRKPGPRAIGWSP